MRLFLLLKQSTWFIANYTDRFICSQSIVLGSTFRAGINILYFQTAEMDVDGDVDSQLLQQFSSMATTDREVLIAEFQRLLGNQLSDAGCAFFLDMNNWQVLIF